MINWGIVFDEIATSKKYVIMKSTESFANAKSHICFKLIYFKSISKQVLRTYIKPFSMFASLANQWLLVLIVYSLCKTWITASAPPGFEIFGSTVRYSTTRSIFINFAAFKYTCPIWRHNLHVLLTHYTVLLDYSSNNIFDQWVARDNVIKIPPQKRVITYTIWLTLHFTTMFNTV